MWQDQGAAGILRPDSPTDTFAGEIFVGCRKHATCYSFADLATSIDTSSLMQTRVALRDFQSPSGSLPTRISNQDLEATTSGRGSPPAYRALPAPRTPSRSLSTRSHRFGPRTFNAGLTRSASEGPRSSYDHHRSFASSSASSTVNESSSSTVTLASLRASSSVPASPEASSAGNSYSTSNIGIFEREIA